VVFLIVLQITLGLAVLDLVERRLGDIHVAALDQFGHLAIEQRQQQGTDVRAVHVRVGHDDDAVITQFFDLEFVLADAGAERGDQGDDLFAGNQLVETGFLDVQHLAAQRQNGLELAVTTLFGGTAGGIALDDVNFAKAGSFS
jgi:hypothetical protein